LLKPDRSYRPALPPTRRRSVHGSGRGDLHPRPPSLPSCVSSNACSTAAAYPTPACLRSRG
jgi:hypothetical protein